VTVFSARRGWPGVAAVASVALAGCVSHPVGPARTFERYEDKAVTTAEAALSAVSTTMLAADIGTDGGAWGTYLSVVVSEQEDEIASVQGTFASVQPPDTRADALRQQLDDILTPAVAHVTDVRVTVRRGRLNELADVAAPLSGDQTRLRAFLADHQ
jgi:hypothetical protein